MSTWWQQFARTVHTYKYRSPICSIPNSSNNALRHLACRSTMYPYKQLHQTWHCTMCGCGRRVWLWGCGFEGVVNGRGWAGTPNGVHMPVCLPAPATSQSTEPSRTRIEQRWQSPEAGPRVPRWSSSSLVGSSIWAASSPGVPQSELGHTWWNEDTTHVIISEVHVIQVIVQTAK